MIKDSGDRTEFESGAVRDVQSLEKGRCDLLPLDVIADYMSVPSYCKYGSIFNYIGNFQKTGNDIFLQQALLEFCAERGWDPPTMVLEVAVHTAEGCQKYGERNWQKGIPLSRYVDSTLRHYLKWLRGDDDEFHDRAVCWNLISGIWTCRHHPHLNEYKQEDNNV